MRTKILPSLLSLAMSICMLPGAGAAGMIVIDPLSGAMPHITRPAPPPGHRPPRLPQPPLLKGAVSFGLRLQSSEVRVDIVDQVAKTYIIQTFANDTDRNLAGTYLFPLPEDTTFSSFSLHIDGKPVEGKILEAHEARQQYEDIVRRMVDPGLLEYANDRTVRARIFPIPAHGTKKVELEYTQLLKGENGMIKYRYPLKAEGDSSSTDDVKINVKIGSKQGLRTIWSPSHIINAKRDGNNKAQISFAEKDMLPDKDFLLYYSVSDKDLAANLLNHKNPNEDGYFLLTLTPPAQAKEVIHKDIVFAADCSGSMQGERMEQNKKALKYLVNALNASDKFSIVAFSTDVELYKSHLVQATPESKKAACEFIDDLNAAGGTNIGGALKAASTILSGARPSYLVLMTDGEPTVGETSVAALLKTVDTKKDIRLFDFGVGYDVNTRLLNKLADSHHGTSEYVEPNESLEVALSGFYEKIKSPVLSDVKINYGNLQIKDVYPRNVKDIFAGSQIMLLGRYKGSGASNIQLSGTVNGVQKSYNFPLKFEAEEVGHTYLPRLWAMRRIAHLTEVAQENGENREIIEEIVALSKKFGIISNYTSFLATDPNESNQRFPAVPQPTQVTTNTIRAMNGSMGGIAAGGGATPAPRAQRASRMEPLPLSAFNQMERDFAPDKRTSLKKDRFDGQNSGKRESFDEEKLQLGDLAGSQVSGKLAVLRAKEMSRLKQTVALNNKNNGTKIIEDKTFYLRNGVWIDSAFEELKHQNPENIAFGSEAYFSLLKQNPGIAKYLAAGKQVLLVYKGHCYRITYKEA